MRAPTLDPEQRRQLEGWPLDTVDDGGGLATWAAGMRPDGLPGVYSLSADGGRRPVWAGLRPATMRDAVAMASGLNRRVAVALGATR